MNLARRITKAGFSLVELAVIVSIISVMAAVALPRFRTTVERSKAAEAFNYLTSVQTAQERYHARHNTFANDLKDLDIMLPAPKHFSVGSIGPGSPDGLEDSWTLSLTRFGASAGFGEYSVIFTEKGFDKENSTIVDHPDIHPMQI